MNYYRIFAAALDIIAKFQGSSFPIKNICQEIIKKRKLNNKQRNLVQKIIYDWVLNKNLLALFYEKNYPEMSKLDKLAQEEINLSIIAWPEFSKILDSKFEILNREFCEFYALLDQDKNLWALGAKTKNNLEEQFGNQASKIAEGLLERAQICLAVDMQKYTPEIVINKLKQKGFDAWSHSLVSRAVVVNSSHGLDLALKEFGEDVWVMDAGSQFICDWDILPTGAQVLDLCAGEGQKAKILAQKNINLTLVDICPKRLARAQERIRKPKVRFVVSDGTNYDFGPQKFDVILIDAPCSGSGMIRRQPDIILRMSEKKNSHYISTQEKLLTHAVDFLAPRGVIIYTTCSLDRAENQEQVLKINKKKNLVGLELEKLWGVKASLVSNRGKNWGYLLPHQHNTDGFFFAAIKKT